MSFLDKVKAPQNTHAVSNNPLKPNPLAKKNPLVAAKAEGDKEIKNNPFIKNKKPIESEAVEKAAEEISKKTDVVTDKETEVTETVTETKEEVTEKTEAKEEAEQNSTAIS